MPFRPAVLLVAALLVGCSPDADSQTGAAVRADGPAPPSGGPVVAVDGERQRLSVAQMLAYLPETAGRFAARGFDHGGESDETDASGAVAGGITGLTVTYADTVESATSSRVTVSLRDLIDGLMTTDYERGQIEQREYAGMTDGLGGVTVTDGTAGGLATQEFRGASMGPVLRMLIADRFVVTVQQAGGSSEIEDMVALVEGSFLPALATAPAFADAGDPAVPEWAAAGVARSEERVARRLREADADAAEREAEAEATGPLPACDDLLSAGDVASVVGAPVRVLPTPGVAEDGRACNRGYRAEGVAGSVILIVSRFARANQAEGALRVASDHDGKVGLAPLAGGLNGVRYTHDLNPDTHVSHFARGVDFVELKAAPGLADAPGVTPDQLARLTALVAEHLGR